MSPRGEVTRLLQSWSERDSEAQDRLFSLIYDELRRLAQVQLRREGVGHTLDTGALVHEAYLKLVQIERVQWNDRTHFFSTAARAMRRVLVNYAVSRNAEKRGAGQTPVTLEDATIGVQAHSDEIVALDQALERLEALEPRHARVVECRVFAGMNLDETAAALAVSPATVKRDWTMARAWLNQELSA